MDQHPQNILSEYLHEPFMMFAAGFILYFLVVWKRGRNAGKWNGKGGPSFFHDQKDEMSVAAIAGLIFIAWDSQILHAIDDLLTFTDKYLEKYNVNLLSDDRKPLKMKTYYYFLVAPGVEAIAFIITIIRNKAKRLAKKIGEDE